MSDIEVRIYDLSNEAAPTDDVLLVIDNPDWTEPRNTTKAQFLADEILARDTADTEIKDGCGLNSDGTFSTEPSSTYLRNSDFSGAGYDVNIRNAALLLDYAISQLAQTHELNIIVNLSSADILNCNTSPVAKIPSPILGNFYRFAGCCAKNNFVSAAYSCGASGIMARFIGGSDPIVTFPQAFVQSASTVRKNIPISEHEITLNAGVEFYASDGDPTTGDGNIDVIMRYESLEDFKSIPALTKRCCVYPLTDSFTNADLTASGNLVITHNQNTPDIMASIQDNAGLMTATTFTLGDESGVNPNNVITIPVGLGIVGTWKYMLLIKVI